MNHDGKNGSGTCTIAAVGLEMVGHEVAIVLIGSCSHCHREKGIHCQCPSRQIHSRVAWRPKPVLIGLSMSAVLCLLGLCFALLLGRPGK